MPCRVIQTGEHLSDDTKNNNNNVIVCFKTTREKCLVTMSLAINDTLKWLSSLPLLIMEESFWW